MIRQKVQVHLWRVESGGGRLFAIFHRCEAKGDYWQPITGNVEAGETPEQCALREVAEEAGVDADLSDLTPCLEVQDWRREETRFAEHVFGLRCKGESITISGEHRAAEWVGVSEALARFYFEGNRRGLHLVEKWLEGAGKS